MLFILLLLEAGIVKETVKRKEIRKFKRSTSVNLVLRSQTSEVLL